MFFFYISVTCIQEHRQVHTQEDRDIKQMKLGKAPGLDGIPIEMWQLPKLRKDLLKFCNETYLGNRPPEWGISVIVPRVSDVSAHNEFGPWAEPSNGAAGEL